MHAFPITAPVGIYRRRGAKVVSLFRASVSKLAFVVGGGAIIRETSRASDRENRHAARALGRMDGQADRERRLGQGDRDPAPDTNAFNLHAVRDKSAADIAETLVCVAKTKTNHVALLRLCRGR